jgi:hypothetical protein
MVAIQSQMPKMYYNYYNKFLSIFLSSNRNFCNIYLTERDGIAAMEYLSSLSSSTAYTGFRELCVFSNVLGVQNTM